MLSISISEEEDPNQGEPSLSKTGSTSHSQLPSPGSPTWHSPLEKDVVEKDWHSQLSNFGLALGMLLGISHSCVKLLGKLAYTKWWLKRVVEKGYPRFLFFWIPNSKEEPVSERRLFNLLLCIVIFNFVILFALCKML